MRLYPADQLRGRDAVVPRLKRKEKESPDSGQVYRFARIDNDSVVYAIITRRCNEFATRLPSAYRVRLFTTDTLREKSCRAKRRRIFFHDLSRARDKNYDQM